jgi:hypothetical protein
MTKTREQYRRVGAGYGSGAVAKECQDAAQRWKDDLEVLRRYGFTAKSLESFLALMAEHAAARADRPDAAKAKTAAVRGATHVLASAHQWLDRAYAILGNVAQDNPAIADDVTAEVAAIEAERNNGLDAEVAAALKTVRKNAEHMDPDVEPATLMAEGEALLPQIRAALPGKAQAKTAAKVDTEEIDVLDGRLLEIVSSLNNAGRKAFRAKGQRARVQAYKYHHLRGRPSETADDVPADPTPPSE